MYRIAFWNINRKSLSEQILELAKSCDLDVLILVEAVDPITDTLQTLKAQVSENFYIPDDIASGSDGRFQCFCKNRALSISEVHEGFRMSIRELKLGSTSALLGLMHGVDMRNYDMPSRQSAVEELANELRVVKKTQMNNKIVVIGDFNMNPYDTGMNLARGLNAMMAKSCIRKGQRTFLNKNYDFYYNPMWNLLGDETPGPPGTCYDTSNQGPYGWSMLDQVIVNHSMISAFEKVQIITKVGNHDLTDNLGRPDSKTASDHFPIMVELKEII